MVAPNLPKYCYRVNVADRLIWVDSWWLAFARENGAAGLTYDSVVGRSLWEFVSGDETCRLFQAIHVRVRTSGVSVVLPFRCDSPSLQRHMRLTISREASGQLHYESVLLRAELQHPLEVLNVERTRSDAFLTMCSCCKRSLLEPSGWLEIEDVSARLRLFDAPQLPELRYTICPKCAASMIPPNGNGLAPCVAH